MEGFFAHSSAAEKLQTQSLEAASATSNSRTVKQGRSCFAARCCKFAKGDITTHLIPKDQLLVEDLIRLKTQPGWARG